MLSAHAYSLRQKSRLAISLAWIGGFTNVVAIGAMGTLVSNISGTATQLGEAIGLRNLHGCLFYGSLLLSFLAGATISALTTETAKRRGWRSEYILPIALEAAVLSFVAAYLTRNPIVNGDIAHEMACLAAFAMGVQNATITKISGAVVRTTHVTGIFTDVGIEAVHYFFWMRDRLRIPRPRRLRRALLVSFRQPSAERLLLLASIAGSFGFGAVVGIIMYNHWAAAVLFAPVLFLLWIIFVDMRTPIADVRVVDQVNDPEFKLLNLVHQLLPPDIALYRFECDPPNQSHRAPNFQLWQDRLPEDCRVVVLAVSHWTTFDANAVLDLEAAVKKLLDSDSTLVLAGLSRAQFKALDDLGVARLIGTENLCTDLEFAIARALLLSGHPFPHHVPVMSPVSSH